MFTVTSYATKLVRGQQVIVSETATAHTKLSEAIEVKNADNSVIVFVGCEKNELSAVQERVAKDGLELYPTRRDNRYILGRKRAPVIACSLE